MGKNNRFINLVKELSRDPRLKRAFSQAKRQIRRKGATKVESMTDFFLLSLAIGTKFISKRKARALDELIEVVYLLVQVSLLLKENIFDRPEVKEFFSQQFKPILSISQGYIDRILPKRIFADGGKLR